jgi:hypothetical protein
MKSARARTLAKSIGPGLAVIWFLVGVPRIDHGEPVARGGMGPARVVQSGEAQAAWPVSAPALRFVAGAQVLRRGYHLPHVALPDVPLAITDPDGVTGLGAANAPRLGSERPITPDAFGCPVEVRAIVMGGAADDTADEETSSPDALAAGAEDDASAQAAESPEDEGESVDAFAIVVTGSKSGKSLLLRRGARLDTALGRGQVISIAPQGITVRLPDHEVFCPLLQQR